MRIFQFFKEELYLNRIKVKIKLSSKNYLIQIKYILLIYIRIFGVSLICIFVLVLFKKILGFELPTPKISDKTFLFKSFNILLYAPFVEEIIHRLWLTNKKKHVFVSLIFLFLDFLIRFLLKSPIDYFSITLIFVIIISYHFDLMRIYPKILLTINSILFGYSHIVNYDLNYSNILIYLSLMPQVLTGHFLNKVRLEKGIQFSIIIHALLNLTSYLFFILFK